MSAPVTLKPKGALPMGSAFGIELEYMIVDSETLQVRPIADKLLAAVNGGDPTDFEVGHVAWSNELVNHVIELKTNGPTPSLEGWADAFHANIRRIDGELDTFGARLMPGAMHPTMDPKTETQLWSHDYSEVYARYHRIFDCHRHGWANLQSCHINLPFKGDGEFERLHAAIRALLPLMPALAASSPAVDGKVAGALDQRLEVYCGHQSRIPEAMGLVVPEVFRTAAEYDEGIFEPLRRAAAKLDPEGLLVPEFLNARGAIARFGRNAVEIRVLDVQEAPRMDLAVALLVTSVVEALTQERWAPLADLHALSTESLRAVFDQCMKDADETLVTDVGLLAALGRKGPIKASALWRDLTGEVRKDSAAWTELGPSLQVILDEGPLSRRLLRALGAQPSPGTLRQVWLKLAGCLRTDTPFTP